MKVRGMVITRMRWAARLAVVCLAGIGLVGLTGCGSGGGGGGGKGGPADGVYFGNLSVEETQTLAAAAALPEGNAYTLVSGSRGILFTSEGLVSGSGGSPFALRGGDINIKVKKITDEAHEVTGFEGTAKGDKFAFGFFDGTVTMNELSFPGFTEYTHLPNSKSDFHPNGMEAAFSADNGGSTGTYSASFLSELYNQPSNVEYLANLNTLNEPLAKASEENVDIYWDQGGGAYLVYADGSFKTAFAPGCVLEGEFSQLDKNHNLYAVKARIRNQVQAAEEEPAQCGDVGAPTGDFDGLAFAEFSAPPGEVVEEDETADVIVLSVTGGSGEGSPYQVSLKLTRTTEAGPILDSDGDGVPDSYPDACPDTPPGTTVYPNGCPIAVPAT